MNYIKLAVAFAAGVGVGVLGTKKYFETKYDKIFEEEYESVINSRIGLGHIDDTNSMDDEEFAKVIEEELKNPDSEFHTSIDDMFAKNEDEVVRSHAEQEHYMKELAEKEHPIAMSHEEPYQITEEEYAETELSFDKLCIHYYTEDEALVYADSSDAVDAGSTIGVDNLDIVKYADDGYLYFRNYTYGADYEVIRIKGSYYIDVGD